MGKKGEKKRTAKLEAGHENDVGGDSEPTAGSLGMSTLEEFGDDSHQDLPSGTAEEVQSPELSELDVSSQPDSSDALKILKDEYDAYVIDTSSKLENSRREIEDLQVTCFSLWLSCHIIVQHDSSIPPCTTQNRVRVAEGESENASSAMAHANSLLEESVASASMASAAWQVRSTCILSNFV